MMGQLMGLEIKGNKKAHGIMGLIESPGGEGGIRTHGRLAPTPDFESGTFDHSATSPSPAIITTSVRSWHNGGLPIWDE